jgi:serine/threonine protein kinase
LRYDRVVPLSGPDPPTYLLEGRYLAEKLIAGGETTHVFSGTDTWSGEHVAIRILRSDRPEREAAFQRMSERLFGATSARLVRAIHIGEDRIGMPFLVTELLVGRNVESLGRVRWEVACEITRQAAAAIAEMHILGLHHGSLRPSTLFVGASSGAGARVKLLDLGFGDRAATAEKDVRALANILHRLITGADIPADAQTVSLPPSLTKAPPTVEYVLSRCLLPGVQQIMATDLATELKGLVEASTDLYGSQTQRTSRGPRVVRTSLIELGDADVEDDEEPT